MSKTKYSVLISLAVLIAVAVYSSILFLLVERTNAVFYISYGFTLFAAVAFWASLMSVLIKPKSLNEAFLNEPYLSASIVYGIAQFVFGLWCIFQPSVSWQSVLSICILFCGIYLVCSIFLVAGINLNKTVDADINAKRLFLRGMLAELSGLQFSDEQAQKAFIKLCDDVKYSDPMSRAEHQVLENEILLEVQNLVNLQAEKEAALEQINLIKKLLKKRNDLIKFS